MNTKKKNYIEGLDAMRGIAILGVVFYHLIPGKFPGGFLGVNMFFVLSGYLIYKGAEWEVTNGKYSVQKFYMKRIKKIFPPLIIMICSVCGMLAIFIPEVLKGKTSEIISVFGGYNNLWQIQQNASYFARMSNQSPFTHLWAIAIEMQFYIVWPVLFFMIKRSEKYFSKKKTLIIIALVVLVGGAWMSVLYSPQNDVSRLYYGTDTRMFSLLMGVLVAIIQNNLKHSESKIVSYAKNIFLVMLSVVCICGYFIVEGQSAYVYLGGLFVNSVICALIVLLMSGSGFSRVIEKSPLTIVGKISYEIYLWMYPIIFIFGYYKANYGIASWVIQILLILGIAIVQNCFTKRLNTNRIRGKKNKFVKSYLAKSYLSACIVLIMCILTVRCDLSKVLNRTLIKADENKVVSEIKNENNYEKKNNDIANNQEPVTLKNEQVNNKDYTNEKKKKTKKQQIKNEKITIIGDSVLLGASAELKKINPNIIIDAKVSRQVSQAKDIVKNLEREGKLGDIVVIALGTNGTFSASTGKELIKAIGAKRQIYWVNVFGEHLQWQEESNHMIESVVNEYKNVNLIDWSTYGESHKDWFVNDGIHLTESGCKAYATLLYNNILNNINTDN
ncbi:acyltransferase family protein [uncultured Eubacterium sp.]|uniref:acyltransferase family protein n=1 Tax=Eubacterium sp. TaxID=142586 RepID=UPI0032676D41